MAVFMNQTEYAGSLMQAGRTVLDAFWQIQDWNIFQQGFQMQNCSPWMLLLRDEKEMNFQIDSSGKVY